MAVMYVKYRISNVFTYGVHVQERLLADLLATVEEADSCPFPLFQDVLGGRAHYTIHGNVCCNLAHHHQVQLIPRQS